MASFTSLLKNIFLILLILNFSVPVIKNIKKQWDDHADPKNKVGLIVISQAIMSSTSINKQLKTFFADPEIKAILLKIESGGGASGAGQAICEEITNLKRAYPKPIITYCEMVCASAAYQIASKTDYIITTGSALVGSIGSKFSTQFRCKKLLEDWKIQVLDISSGSYKNCFDPFVDITNEQKILLKELSDNAYNQFVNDVAQNRHLSLTEQEVWANGKIFTGQMALSLKLIDEIGNQSAAIQYLKKQILHADREIELIRVPQPSKLQKLLQGSSDNDDDLENSISNSIWSSFFRFLDQNHSHL